MLTDNHGIFIPNWVGRNYNWKRASEFGGFQLDYEYEYNIEKYGGLDGYFKQYSGRFGSKDYVLAIVNDEDDYKIIKQINQINGEITIFE